MIRVTVELIPMGWGTPETLGTLEIANDGRETQRTDGRLGTYGFDFLSKKGTLLRRSGVVVHWPRKRNSVWSLVKKCLEEGGY